MTNEPLTLPLAEVITDRVQRATPNQLEAVQHAEGPLLIIAGPGSGKTFTLVERIAYLVTQHDVSPEEILVVTFTDKAAQELTTRVSARLDAEGLRFTSRRPHYSPYVKPYPSPKPQLAPTLSERSRLILVERTSIRDS